jgi:short-subunit dehydrogenase
MMDFSGQVVVITGASSGIGKAIALGFAARKAKICIVGRNSKRLDEVAKAARTLATDICCYRVDLSLYKEITKLSKHITDDHRQVNVLIHSAGVIKLGPVESTRVADLDWQYRTNIRAPYLLTQALLPALIQHQGQIVFINSSAGLSARANTGQYAATKHALKAVSDSLRDEINAYGVRVLSVFPGRTATSMQASVHEIEGKPYFPEKLLQPEDVASVVIHALSLPKTAEVTDIKIRPMLKT